MQNCVKLELHLQLFATVRPRNEQMGRTISGSVQLSSHSLAWGKTEQQMFWLSSAKVKTNYPKSKHNEIKFSWTVKMKPKCYWFGEYFWTSSIVFRATRTVLGVVDTGAQSAAHGAPELIAGISVFIWQILLRRGESCSVKDNANKSQTDKET